MSEANQLEQLRAAADAVAAAQDADVILFNGPIQEDTAQQFVRNCRKVPSRRKNAILIISTYGGDPHAAYIMARCLQRLYSGFDAFIVGDCYSAGALLVMGAKSLVIADGGHLGPVDIQVRKKDELGEHSSGMIVSNALDELQRRALTSFETFMVELKVDSGGSVTLRTAMDVATQMTIGLYGELYKQIDPQRIGEDARAMRIIEHYGGLLSKETQNVLPGTIKRLLEEYPDHGCIIDREEAAGLFARVREPQGPEVQMSSLLDSLASVTVARAEQVVMMLLSTPVPLTGDADEATNADGTNHENSNGTGGSRAQTRRAKAGAAHEGATGGDG